MAGNQHLNQECTDLYKDAKKLLNASMKTIAKLENTLRDLIGTKAQHAILLAPGDNAGRLKALHDIEPLFDGLRSNLVEMKQYERKFAQISRNEKSCKKTFFFRLRHVMTSMEKAKLSQAYLLHKSVSTLLHLVCSRNKSISSTSSDWLYVLKSIESLNSIIQDFSLQSEADSSIYTLIHGRRHRGAHLHENFAPSHFIYLRPISTSKVFQVLSSQRSSFLAVEIVRSITLGIDAKTLQLASEEAMWLSTNGFPSGTRLILAQPIKKNKDGEGNKSKNRNSISPPDVESPTSDYFSQNGNATTTSATTFSHFTMIEETVTNEEHFLSAFFNVLTQVPGLIGKCAEDVSNRLPKATKVRMAEYYHDLLWQKVGSRAESILLWGSASIAPVALQNPRLCIGLANLLSDNLYAKFGDGYPPVVFPCLQILVENLNLHVLSTSWDSFHLRCLAESSRTKIASVNVEDMRSGTLVSKTGKLFYDTLKAIVHFNNRCHPDMMRDFVEHGSHDAEEYPFLEEQHALRRLLTTLYSIRNWANARAHATLKSWQVQDFLLITQADLLNLKDCFSILQLETHERNSQSRSVNIQFHIHIQNGIMKEIVQCEKHIREIPNASLDEMSRTCSTITLATLQNVFPAEKFWRQAGTQYPSKACAYVTELIDRVLGPIFSSLTEMKIEIQQKVARIAIKAFCYAWLEHIKLSKIKFSNWGARQIGLDFSALRHWISKNESICNESRRYLLLLDSLRQCEGVAKLLQSKSGDHLDVVPQVKNKISPLVTEDEHGVKTPSRPESPVNQILDSIPAELYVPNQQQWLNLRANSKLPSLPFPCCRQ